MVKVGGRGERVVEEKKVLGALGDRAVHENPPRGGRRMKSITNVRKANVSEAATVMVRGINWFEAVWIRNDSKRFGGQQGRSRGGYELFERACTVGYMRTNLFVFVCLWWVVRRNAWSRQHRAVGSLSRRSASRGIWLVEDQDQDERRWRQHRILQRATGTICVLRSSASDPGSTP